MTYDGDGGTTRRVTVNAPDGMGDRRLIVFNSVGWYGVNADGTGTATYDNEISTGSMTQTTFDFVITEVQGIFSRRRGAKLAQAIYSVQREPGVTVFARHQRPNKTIRPRPSLAKGVSAR